MRAWIAGAGLVLLVGATSCGKGKEVEPAAGGSAPAAEKSSAPDHSQHGGAPQADKGMAGMPGMPAGTSLPGYASVQVDDSRRQLLGIRTVAVSRAQLQKTIRTVGLVAADEKRASQVHVKFEGFIERIFVDYVGQKVQKGQPLFTIYSQDLLAAQHDYLSSKAAFGRIPDAAVAAPARQASSSLTAAARQRLELFDVPRGVLAEIDRTGVPQRYITINSPQRGTVVEKKAVAGLAVDPMTALYVIADLDRVWVLADVQERDMAQVKLGQEARLTVDALPGQALTGKVAFVSPTMGDATRTAKARIEFANPAGVLKPGMYATVMIDVGLGEGIAIPEDAIIDTGERKIVFVAHEGGHFEPRAIEVGTSILGLVQVLSGLKAGESIAETGQFLLDSESRLRAAAAGGAAPAHSGH
jgi:Cu(I)/Ag(I) efflux system membrane fusion protein